MLLFRGDVVVVSTSSSTSPSPSSSPSLPSSSYSHTSTVSSALHPSLPLRVSRSNFAAYTVVSIVAAAAAAANSATTVCHQVATLDPAVDRAALPDACAASAETTSAAPAAEEEFTDLVVCTATTRVVVTAAAGDGPQRVFLPAWAKLWEGMAPVPVGLMLRDAWAHIHRLSRALRVIHRWHPSLVESCDTHWHLSPGGLQYRHRCNARMSRACLHLQPKRQRGQLRKDNYGRRRRRRRRN
jgi:hypothetical protein